MANTVDMIRVKEGGRVSKREADLRIFSNTLCISRFCDRASCKRGKQCRGGAERCLTLYSDCVPREVRQFVIDLMVSREFGYSFEEALRRDKAGMKAFCSWSASVIPGRMSVKSRSSWPDLIRPSMKRSGKLSLSMDCRVKPGNDEVREGC